MKEENRDKKEKLEAAARMIENAFGSDPLENHPLRFIRESRFQGIVSELSKVYEQNECDTKELICSIVELLMRTTEYTNEDPRTAVLAARSTPIMRQMLFEHKGASEIMVVVAAILTNLALYATGGTNQD